MFAGDIVPKKKPDPAIYLLAAKELGVNPARCVLMSFAMLCPLCWGCKALPVLCLAGEELGVSLAC